MLIHDMLDVRVTDAFEPGEELRDIGEPKVKADALAFWFELFWVVVREDIVAPNERFGGVGLFGTFGRSYRRVCRVVQEVVNGFLLTVNRALRFDSL